METHHCFRLSVWGLVLVLCGLSAGCADGPFSDWAGLNPYVRRQWAEDEKLGPTFHQRLHEVRSLADRAGRMAAEQQQQVSRDLVTLIDQESNPLLRAAAVRSLAAFSTPQVSVGLNMGLADADSQVRIAACQAWGTRADDQAVSALANTLGGDTDLDVRLAAARALGQFPDPRAVQALGLALDDTDPALQHRAVQSLRTATGLDYGDNLVAWKQYLRGEIPARSPTLADRLRRWF